jgi:tetratricopeptide (TPR) repeat protein
MDSTPAKLRIILTGPFRVMSPHGTDVPIRSQKARGLLALLALAPRGLRARVWLQDKLWSDRGRDQAAASLRQALSQIRVELAPYGDVLVATRDMVGLDLAMLELVLDTQTDAEFLEGLDVRDAEFEAWLRAERSVRTPHAPGNAGPFRQPPAMRQPGHVAQVYLVSEAAPAATERLTEDIFLDCLACSLRETLAPVIYRRAPGADVPDAVTVTAQVILSGPDLCALRVSIEQGTGRRVIWTGMRHVPRAGNMPTDHDAVLALVHETTDALADGLLLQKLRTQEPLDAAMMGRFALRKIFMMQPDAMVQADALLARAFDMDPHPNMLAWRIQLRVIQWMERHPTVASLEEIEQLIAQALLLDPNNSMVLAASANARMLVTDDAAGAAQLAQSSLMMNPANPFAWDCMSIGLLVLDRLEEAHQHQRRANVIAARAPIRHFWDMGACLTSVVTGRYDEALRLAQSAAALVPTFRPPLRYLTALHAQMGDHDRALVAARRLVQLEPDFTLDKLHRDPSYPVYSLRKSGLLHSDVMRDLATTPLSP